MLHYFENNGRAEGDPWSPRQTAVYHQYNASGNQSSWILIKPSPHLEKPLQAELEGVSRLALSGKGRAARLHVMFTYFALRNWPDYIAAQTTKLERFVLLFSAIPLLFCLDPVPLDGWSRNNVRANW